MNQRQSTSLRLKILPYPHKKTRLTDISITDSPLGPKGSNLHNDLVVLTDLLTRTRFFRRWKRYPQDKALTNSSDSRTGARKRIRLLGPVKMLSKVFLCLLTPDMAFFFKEIGTNLPTQPQPYPTFHQFTPASF